MFSLPYKKLKKFKVLVVTPHNEVKNYCLDDFLSRLTNLTYKNYDILIADNSKTKKNVKMLMARGIPAIYIKPKKKVNQKYILESHEALRFMAIKGKYDFMLHLESDIIPPHDIIERLLVHQKQVVSASYFIGQGEDSHLMVQEIEDRGELMRETRNVENGQDIMLMDGKLKQVYACGLGTMLIHKSVFEKVKFRWEEGAPVHPDTYFANDLNILDIKQYLDTSILVEHRNQTWTTVTDAVR